jgi:aspartate racemase
MKTLEFLSYLRSLEVKVWAEGDRLRYNAPKGILTSELLDELRSRKAEILAFLHQDRLGTPPSIQPRSRQVNSPLSFAQTRLWFLEQLEPDSPVYYIRKAVRLSGTLNLEALQKALDAIVERHEALRTNFIAELGNPVQVIASSRPVELCVIDLSALTSNEQAEQVKVRLAQETQRPFNLSAGLMLRASLLQLNSEEHILLLVMHHIASDGWSMGILYRELAALYEAFSTGKPLPLTPLPIQYADYADWQRQWLTGEVLSAQIDYWKKQLDGAPPVLELPTDHPRPAVQSYRGAKHFVSLPPSLTESLQAISRASGVTLFMTLLAAFQTLLYRYSGQEDIVVGSPIAGRTQVETEGLIGFFVNTLVLRTELSGNPTFRELLERVRQVALGAYAHQDLPFEKLVEELRPERSLSYTPLFQVMFVLQNTPMRQSLKLPGLTLQPWNLDSEIAMFDLSLAMWETEQGLQGEWEYNTDLFDAATITRMAGHFQTLLEGIVANLEQRVSELPLLTASERHQLLVEWNDTRGEYPLDKCIHQLFEATVERTPDAVAVMLEDQQLTYRELNIRANQLAHYLQGLGVEPDVLVGISIERSLEMVVGLLGILKAGGAYVPLDPAYPKERLSYMLSDSQVPILLTQDKLVSELPDYKVRVVALDRDWQVIATETQENLVTEVKPSNLAYIIYTSGSTGKPKGVMIEHQSVVNLTETMRVKYGMVSSDRVLQFSSISFDSATDEIYNCLTAGGTLVLRTDEMLSSVSTFLQKCREWQVSVLELPTAYWHQIVSELATTGETLPTSVRLISVGGEAVLPEKLRLWQRCVDEQLRSHKLGEPPLLINGYGPTEATVEATICKLSELVIEDTLPQLPIGRPIGNVQAYILDRYLQPVPIGVPGELHIGGVCLARGYLNRPDLTGEKFIANPFNNQPGTRLYKTGDLVRYLPDGNIEYLGRIDNQVKIRGFRIELGEIETVLGQHPAIRETLVVVREDVPGDKRLVAYLIPKQEPALTISELRHFLKEKLPNYMIPSAFVMLESIPLTPNDKVDYRALPAPNQVNQETGETFVAPRDKLELQLTEIWEKVLGIQPINVTDNFFDLGGHSLLAVRLFAEIEQVFRKKLPLATLFQAATVEAMASIIRQEEWLAPWDSLVPIQPGGSKPPLFCIQGAGGNILIYRDLALSLGSDQPVYGLQARGLDGKVAPHTRLEDMAAHYIAQIKMVQPEGPYYLAGLSGGGNVALEMAQQLNAQGQKVALLALFDTYGPGASKLLPPIPRFLSVLRWAVFDYVGRVMNWPVKLVRTLVQLGIKGTFVEIQRKLGLVETEMDEGTRYQVLSRDQKTQDFMKKAMECSSQMNALEKWINFLMIVILKSSTKPLHAEYYAQKFYNNAVSSLPDELENVKKANIQAMNAYVPQVYPGRAILFQASDRPPGMYHDPLLGWDSIITGGIETYEVPGSHESILKSPVLAEKMKVYLAQAQANSSS